MVKNISLLHIPQMFELSIEEAAKKNFKHNVIGSHV